MHFQGNFDLRVMAVEKCKRSAEIDPDMFGDYNLFADTSNNKTVIRGYVNVKFSHTIVAVSKNNFWSSKQY